MPRQEPPFSNGTEGYAWMSQWCDRCMVDAPFRNGISATGCDLLLTALTGQTPDEWIEQERWSLYSRYHCINFKPPGWRDPEPRPQPEPQPDGLFDRPERGVRMLLPLIDTQTPVAAALPGGGSSGGSNSDLRDASGDAPGVGAIPGSAGSAPGGPTNPPSRPDAARAVPTHTARAATPTET